MRRVIQAYDMLLYGLFTFCSLYVCCIVVSVLWDVAARNLGFFAPVWLDTFAGYGLLVVTMASAPMLVRHRWHVTMDLLTVVVRDDWLVWWQRAIDLAVSLLSAILAGFAFYSGYLSWLHGEIDVQSIDFPRWIAFVVIGTGLFLCMLEFLRHLYRAPDAPRDDATSDQVMP